MVSPALRTGGQTTGTAGLVSNGIATGPPHTNQNQPRLTSGHSNTAPPAQLDLFERQLLEAAKNSLRFELHSNASFLCERLLA